MMVALFGNSVFADVIELRGGHTRVWWALNPIRLVSLQREETDTDSGTMRCDNGGRDLSAAAASQGHQGLPVNIGSWKRRGRSLPQSLRRRHGPAGIVILNV